MACASLNTPASYRPTPAGEALPIPATGADSGSRKGAARCMLCPVWVGPRCINVQEQNGAEQLRMNALLSQLQDKGFDPRSLAFHCVSVILTACWACRKSTSIARTRRQNWRWRRNRNLLVSPPESPWGQQFLVGCARYREAAVKSVDP